MPKESKHVKTLRELGFTPYSELLPARTRRELDDKVERFVGTSLNKITRAQRRKLVSAGILPYFAHIDGCTFAIDEAGGDWQANEEIDLFHLGFKNVSRDVKGMQARLKKAGIQY